MASSTRFYHHFSLSSSSLPLILLLQLFLFSLWSTTPSALADQQQPLQKLPRPKLKFCKLDVLLECFFEPMANFTNTPLGTGFPITEQDFEQWCFVLHDYFPYCGRAWLRRCASPLHHDFLDWLFGQPMRQSMYSLCSEGNYRKEWLTLAECVIHRVKLHPDYRSRCVRQLQANMEHAHLAFFARHRSGPRWWRHFCCTYNAWERCITDELARECGPAASAIFPRMLGAMNFNVMAGVCPPDVYGPSSPAQCPPEEVEAPAEYVPLGLASSNFFSRAFSYACPNVSEPTASFFNGLKKDDESRNDDDTEELTALLITISQPPKLFFSSPSQTRSAGESSRRETSRRGEDGKASLEEERHWWEFTLLFAALCLLSVLLITVFA